MSKFAATKYTYSFLHAKTQKKQSTNFVVCHLCDKEQKTSKADSKTAKLQILQKERKELANAKMIWL